MTLKSLLFKILIVLGVLLLLFILALYFTLKTKKKDISKQFPYAEIVNTTVKTKHLCYIVKNYDDPIKEASYLIKLKNEFPTELGTPYKIPTGTSLRITQAKAFTNGVSGFTTNYVFGDIYVEALEKTVPFQYEWNAQKPFEIKDYDNYLVYPLTPWQKQPIPYKILIENNTKSDYTWPLTTTNEAFNELLSGIWNTTIYMGNSDFENTTFEKERYEAGMKYYAEPSYQILPEEYSLLQLEKVYTDIHQNTFDYVVGNDHRLNLSQNFVSIILTIQIKENTIESVLINYDDNGKYIDHLMIASAHRSKGALQVCTFNGPNIAIEKKSGSNTNAIDRVNYVINNDGVIVINK
ncbi:hypothetical protein [Costertonia aggregata]|uniref:Uncharacterized protein n=1 Tax=Costertonia aggregata TaxID=343403 RepID=A0A7H9AQM5_9FLAO|nr:hypothetical protein [Costertonia aggregata]QLG45758.1 hypothetical protein HYG79_10495 [Costertonia aggregata]